METRSRGRNADVSTRGERARTVGEQQEMMNALLFERPIWFTTGPLEMEEAQEMEDFTYHRSVRVPEAVELLAPRAGALVVDATCGGGGHTAEILRSGADVLALAQDPGASADAGERLAQLGGR